MSTITFTSHPFSNFSAEEEVSYLNNIYLKPNYYEEIYENLSTSSSRFIIGKRGIGKSALILDLKNKLKSEMSLTVIVDDYRNIPLKKNINSIINLIIQKIVTVVCLSLLKNKAPLKKLNKEEKEKLTFIITNFYKTLSAREFSKQIKAIVPIHIENGIKRLINKFINPPANVILNTGVSVVHDIIFQHLSISDTSNQLGYRNYFPELKEKELDKALYQKTLLNDSERSINILKDLASIVQKLGYKNTVVMLDKIDEKKELGGEIDKIVKFTQDILLDTSFLQIENIAFGFTLWSEVRDRINSAGVRYDKFPPIDISWSKEQLKSILLKRLNYFSEDKITNLLEVFSDEALIENILVLSNNSPRDLLVLMSKVHAHKTDNGTLYTEESVVKGSSDFVKGYDYRNVFSATKKIDIIAYITKLLVVNNITFTSKQLAASMKISQQSSNSQIKQLKEFGLIKEHYIKNGNEKQYNVNDPKIIFAIENSIRIV